MSPATARLLDRTGPASAVLDAACGTGIDAAAWLTPGLILAGVGMGLAITPLATTVLAHVNPQRAGALAGAMSTMQQVGNSVGVAVTGVIFYGAVQHGYPRAAELSLAQLGCLLLAVAALSRLLPSSAKRGIPRSQHRRQS